MNYQKFYFHIWNMHRFHTCNTENSMFIYEIYICVFIYEILKIHFHPWNMHSCFHIWHRKFYFHPWNMYPWFIYEIQKILFSYMKYTPMFSYIKCWKFHFDPQNMHLCFHIWIIENYIFIHKICTHFFIYEILKIQFFIYEICTHLLIYENSHILSCKKYRIFLDMKYAHIFIYEI